MKIYTYPLGEMQANCYLLVQDNTCLLIDPADSADFILEKIQTLNLELVGIVATHGHFDHIMAVGEIQLSYPHLSLHIHKKDEFLLARVAETAEHFLGYNPFVMPIRLKADLTPGAFSIADFRFQILHTPGHTPGSCCIYFQKEHILFTGDTLFQGGIGRFDFSYSDKHELKSSLQTILKLPGETIVYSGHGEESRIEYEQEVLSELFS